MRNLTISDSVQVQGGLTTSQASFMMTSMISYMGEALLTAALGPEAKGAVIVFVVKPLSKLIISYVGYETTNYVFSD